MHNSHKPVHISSHIWFLPGVRSSNIVVIENGNEKIIIDTGFSKEIKKNIRHLKRVGLDISQVSAIYHTHSHGDHVGGTAYLKKLYPALNIYVSDNFHDFQKKRKNMRLLKGAEDDFPHFEITGFLKDNDRFKIGSLEVIVLNTPGHTSDSISFFIPELNTLISGDIVYKKVITQFDYYQDLDKSLEECHFTLERLQSLHPEIIVTGHGNPITDPDENFTACLRKLRKFKTNPEMMYINTFTPSCEYYIHKHPGCKKEQIIDFFVKNMLLFKTQTSYNIPEKDEFIVILEKMLSLMNLMKIVKIKNNKYYLSGLINKKLGK